MSEEQIEKAEQLLSYYEAHGDDERVFPRTAHSEWWIGEAVALLRDSLPEWSAFKAEEVTRAS